MKQHQQIRIFSAPGLFLGRTFTLLDKLFDGAEEIVDSATPFIQTAGIHGHAMKDEAIQDAELNKLEADYNYHERKRELQLKFQALPELDETKKQPPVVNT